MTDALFTAGDLKDWIHEEVDAGAATMAERVVWGWLMPVLGASVRPDPVTPQLFSWAIELGGIAYENPSGLSSYQLGEERRQYSSERRGEILEEVATGGQTPGAVPQPRGCFPAARRYPDAAERC